MINDRWKAGFTRRWHSNPDLCHTVDPTDGHSARVIKIAMMLHPEISRDGIIYALHHDDGEVGIGDVSGQAKRENRALASQISEAERKNREGMGIVLPELSEFERFVIGLSDRIDAYLWMDTHAPFLSARRDWREMKSGIRSDLLDHRLERSKFHSEFVTRFA